MGETVRFNKDALIDELKQIHKDMVSVYKELFTYKYKNNEDFRDFIEKEYRENGIGNDGKEKWNENFCHRTSYTLINKVLFIRICEDKGFMFNPEEDFIMGEPKDPNIGKKLSARGRDRWISLISNYTFGELLKFAFADMKESFKNIALFKEDKYEKLNPTKQELELKFMLDSKEYKKTPIYSYEENVAKIIEKLDTSKFDFNVPAEGNILGDVYEKFMDRETRKAIGQFYTPDFVIEYILNNTVAEADVVENPFVSVLDPACGSGHFLIMAYDILRKKFEENIDRLREKYADVDYVYKNENMKGKEYWVKDRIHYHILKHCIFGADIDSFAVQLTTINLLLKDLDNFTDELNIMECDSLIKWEEDYDWQDLKQQLKNISMFYTINYKDINGIHRHDTLSRDKAEELVRLCEFWAKKYDYVVGNPPYGVIYRNTDYAKKNYFAAKNTLDAYGLFIERAITAAKPMGKSGLIVPSSWQTNTSFKALREYVLKNTRPLVFINLPYDIFGDAYIDTVIFIIQNCFEKNNCKFIFYDKIKTYSYDKKDKITQINIEECQYTITNNKRWINDFDYKFETFQSRLDTQIVDKIENNSKPLSEYAIVNRGVTPFNLVYHKKGLTYKLAFDGQLLRYNIKWDTKKYIDFTKDNIKEFKNIELFQGKRILLRVLISRKFRLQAALVEEEFINNKSIQNIIPRENSLSAEYLLGVINSKLISYYVNKKYATAQKDDFPQIFIKDTRTLPIALADESKISEIEECVKSIQEINNEINNISMTKCLNLRSSNEIYREYIKLQNYKRQLYIKLDNLDRKIDSLVYEIYGLNEDEINQIEDFFKSKNKFEFSIQNESGEMVNENNSLFVGDNYEEVLKLYDLSQLHSIISEFLKSKAVVILDTSKKYLNVENIRDKLESELYNFSELMNIMRKDNPTKKSKDIVKEALNQFADTWNSYIKNINADKEPKELVKYYDNNYYGLSEWDDEIHKEYFIDAIKEYTEINPNEKKTRDILKLFEGLNIKDKEDYIEIFNSQIKKTFRK